MPNLYDLQDVGARFYTYTTTLGYLMEAAAAHKIPIYVVFLALLGGLACRGPK